MCRSRPSRPSRNWTLLWDERDLQINLSCSCTRLLIKMSRFLLWKQILLLLIVQYTFMKVSSYSDFLTEDGEALVPTFAPFEAGSNGK